jgi:hypothetical protein
MTKFLAALIAVLALVSTPAAATKTHPRRTARLDTGTIAAPVSPFDCDTTRGSTWFGSTRRCLDELCRGRNVTNATVVGGDGRLRTNPCAREVDDRR